MAWCLPAVVAWEAIGGLQPVLLELQSKPQKVASQHKTFIYLHLVHAAGVPSHGVVPSRGRGPAPIAGAGMGLVDRHIEPSVGPCTWERLDRQTPPQWWGDCE